MMQLPADWHGFLGDAWPHDVWHQVQSFLHQTEQSGTRVYPPAPQRFAAFEAVSPPSVKVIILGQDPYHGHGQAHGLSFSVPAGIKPPPSLVNIFKELQRDLGISIPKHGNLHTWAAQGVLLLNSVLTVNAEQAGSHRQRGWEILTDGVIRRLAQEREGLVFMLWGSYAQAKAKLIPNDRHLVLQSPHPSPLSAYRGFIGNGHFAMANRYLETRQVLPIDWSLPAEI